MSEPHKECRKCGECRPLPSFNRDKRLSDGRRNICRNCTRAESAAWREANSEHLASYYKADAQRRKDYQRDWRSANPGKIRTYRRTQAAKSHDYLNRWRAAHGEAVPADTQAPSSPVQPR